MLPPARFFSVAWDHSVRLSLRRSSTSPLGVERARICLGPPPTGLYRDVHHPDELPFYVTPQLDTQHSRYGNINPFPISYAFRPRLRGRLTLSGLPFLRNPWAFGEQVSHLFYRYSCRHTHFPAVHPSLRSGFIPQGTLLYRCLAASHSFGARLKPR